MSLLLLLLLLFPRWLHSLPATTLLLCLSHSLSSSSSSPHPLRTPVTSPKRRAPPALRSPRPDPGTIQNREREGEREGA